MDGKIVDLGFQFDVLSNKTYLMAKGIVVNGLYSPTVATVAVAVDKMDFPQLPQYPQPP